VVDQPSPIEICEPHIVSVTDVKDARFIFGTLGTSDKLAGRGPLCVVDRAIVLDGPELSRYTLLRILLGERMQLVILGTRMYLFLWMTPVRKSPRSVGGRDILLADMSVEPLSEFRNVRQVRAQGFRRWFVNNYFDLIVWYKDNKSSPVGFQLCYDRDGTQRAITWTVEEGFSHTRIDSGDDVSGRGLKMTPILVADGKFDAQIIHDLFAQAAATVDRVVADFVCTKLKQYPSTM